MPCLFLDKDPREQINHGDMITVYLQSISHIMAINIGSNVPSYNQVKDLVQVAFFDSEFLICCKEVSKIKQHSRSLKVGYHVKHSCVFQNINIPISSLALCSSIL